MTNLDMVVEYLEAMGWGTPGVNLFRGNMPDAIHEGLLLTIQTPVTINPYVYALRQGAFQVIARGTDEDEVKQRLMGVSDTLNVQGLELGDMTFRYIKPRHEPLVFPRSGGDLIESLVNFDFVFTVS